MSEPFTLDGYRDLVRALLARGHELKFFAEAEPGAPHLVLRHDIDQSIGAARALAEAEAAEGWRASYFVMLRSEMYNPFSPAARGDLRHIGELGHRIGLHLDPSLYEADAAALDRAAAVECAVLEAILDAPVEDISFHRPPARLLGCDRAFAGRRHAYQPRFFTEMGYCSDSRGNWHYGHPLDHPAVAAGRALQLLTHPIWWGSPAVAPATRLRNLLDERCRVIERELADNCTAYRPRGTDGEHR